MFTFSLLLLVLNIAELHGTEENCPLWTSPRNGTCQCGDDLNQIVKCEEGKGATDVYICFCMTYNYSSPLVGSCLYTCRSTYSTYTKLRTNTSSDINNETCGPFKRTGVQCSKCIEGYGIPAYSFTLSCVKCTDYEYNWIKYVIVAYGPLTLFYIAAVIFRISATSGLMLSYVTICQMITIRGVLQWVANTTLDTKMLITMTSIWNLDFFRSHYTPFCLHPTISALHVLFLDYLVAVYPLILILITYSLVKLHDRYTLVVWFCKPLYICFHKFRKEWDIKTSLVASFATFYLLSYVKILNVTADVLTASYFYDINGEKSDLYFYYNASIPYFGEKHRPFAYFAITFSFLFNVCPLLLLCLYPCTCFHKCLNKTRCRSHTLHIFMDALLGSFSHRPRERRHFGALYLLLRIIHAVAFMWLRPFIYTAVACYLVLIFIALSTAFQPHKKPLHNKIALILFSCYANVFLATIIYNEGTGYNPFRKDLFTGFLYIVSITMPLYGIGVLIIKILPQKFMHNLEHVYEKIKQRFVNREVEESWPHRFEESEREALLNRRLPASDTQSAIHQQLHNNV